MPFEQQIPVEELPEQAAGVMSELLALSCAPVFAQMLPVVRTSIEQNFDSESSPLRVAWPPRKDPGDGHPLLVKTGTLEAAAIGQGTGAMEQLSNRELMVGIDGQVIEYANVQDAGSTKQNIPQREFFGIDEIAEQECEELLADFVNEQIFGEGTRS
jgi:phage gpG-like protein